MQEYSQLGNFCRNGRATTFLLAEKPVQQYPLCQFATAVFRNRGLPLRRTWALIE